MIIERFLISLLILIIIIILVKLLKYQKVLEDKNLKLIQCYLDKKLINTVINNSLKSQQFKLFSLELIENIKNYFQLDDIVIIKYANLEKNDVIANLFRTKLKNIISTHYERQDTQLKNSHIVLDSIEMDDSHYRLYIYFHIEKVDRQNQENIICIKKNSKYLSQDEISTLDTVIHLLRMFLTLDIPQKSETEI